MNKTTALKMIGKQANSARPHLNGRHVLYIAEHDGQLWASNGHWLVPADWFRVVIDMPSVGTWDAKTGELITDDAPNISSLWPSDVDLQELEQSRCHGRYAYVQMTEDDDAALFDFPSAPDKPVAINRRYFDMLKDKPDTGELVLRAKDTLKPILVQVRKSYTHATDGRQEYLSTIGLVMPIRLS